MEIKSKTIIQTLAVMFGTIILGIGVEQLLVKMKLSNTSLVVLLIIGIMVFIFENHISNFLKSKLPDWSVKAFLNPILYAIGFLAIFLASNTYITTFINGHTLMAFIIGAGIITYAPSIVDAILNVD